MGINPHGVRDPETALLLGRVRQECGPFTYGQLFEQIQLDDTPLVRHDRAQLKFMLTLSRKGEPDEYTAEIVAMVGSRWKLRNSETELLYLVHLGENGVSDQDAAEIARRALAQRESVYAAARRYRGAA